MLNNFLLKQKLTAFLKEDLEFGDASLTPLPDHVIEGTFIAKADGIVCGLQVISAVYDLLGGAEVELLISEGEKVAKKTELARVKGSAAVLLSGERVILNLLQHMSGIATKTAQAVQLLADPTIKIVDTRKTMPGLRMFEKAAVRAGGGFNHRMGLTHGIMLKDNHLALAGSVGKAIDLAKQSVGPMTRVEVEVETLSELQEAIKHHADVIMFDNQKPATIKQWQKLVPAGILTEASGGIDLANIAQYQGCGVDFISLGTLTNAVEPLDISFLVNGAIKAK
ncbi:nicotinate-nucleotide pyrophosphorylase [carboxylating] [Limosilactobacillus mucosae]|jgi:nicotinate-nucleotide pyrophosphorylase (carboxylating)|uniref:carboxylating nicotinate-nucleotide diphosphorylase n=1 Tax=Limosilactobacillus mucosae TaxID=97478 RepID=UPI000AB5F621|nr:carboxylating nicotinate-nucleotide diphosphorylase [Limosilactobacillus mucosae]PWJ45144.1 nicotinate-nucleotide pyrophosphorylase [carboxylating] [Limosilactobacillus mucosae]SUQ21285.1 nicotinate-nucleotide pyrophosphorylase [carboxylating] [Limosilactobacillus mucosae]